MGEASRRAQKADDAAELAPERALARRLLPLCALLVALIGTTAPAAIYLLRCRELEGHAAEVADALADLLRDEARARPALWRYDTVKLVEHFRAYEGGNVAAVVITDPEGDVPPGGDSRALAGGAAAPARAGERVGPARLVWASAGIDTGTSELGRVWVGVSSEAMRVETLLMLAGFAALGVVLGAMLYLLPLGALRREERARAADVAARLRLQTLSTRALGLDEDERRRIARDLHDGLGQALTGLRLQLQVLATRGGDDEARHLATRSIGLADEALDEVRLAVGALAPPLVAELGLAEALARYAEGCAQRAGLACEVDVAGLGGVSIPAAIETAAYRIAQEALTNAVRHARATRVVVHAERDAAWLTLSVRDDGIGFDADGAGRGHGLGGIVERAELLGGRAEIGRAPGGGTLVRVVLPLGDERA